MKSLKQKIYSIVSKVPKGKVISYKQIAEKVGVHPRAIAKILSQNAKLITIPCHRVTYADGKIGGYVKGMEAKERLLKKEGVKINKGKIARSYFAK